MINKAILVGRLGKDPEVRSSQAGKQFCTFTLATDSGWGQNKVTDWHTVVCFDKQAENCGRFLKKGSLVYVEGRISYDKYEKDGQTRYTTRIIANSIQFLDTKNTSGFNQSYDPSFDQTGGSAAPQRSSYNAPSAPAAAPAPQSDFGSVGITDDDIPF